MHWSKRVPPSISRADAYAKAKRKYCYSRFGDALEAILESCSILLCAARCALEECNRNQGFESISIFNVTEQRNR